MQYKDVVSRSGRLVWHYRALWVFGALLAVTTAPLAYRALRSAAAPVGGSREERE